MPMKSRYSAFSIARNAFSYHKDWERAWRSPAPKANMTPSSSAAAAIELATAYYTPTTA